MKKLFYFLALLLFVPVLSSCELCIALVISEFSHIDDGWGVPEHVDKYLDFDEDGGEINAEFKNDYSFYMVLVENDTIYYTLDKSYQEKSMLNGYTFEMNNRYISGHGLTLDGTYSNKLKVELDANTSGKQKYMEVIVGHAYDEEQHIWGPRTVLGIRQKGLVEE